MIGVFDSGLGGLTVVRTLTKKLPEYPLIYFGDTARLPYGTKDPQSIKRWSRQNVQWLKEQGAKLIVVACHTASTIAGAELKQEFKLPIFEMTKPLMEIVRHNQPGHCLGIIGTPATIQSGFYQKAFSDSTQVYFQACPLFVPLVEEGWVNKPGTKEIVQETLAPLKKQQVDVLILACTHYPLLRQVIQDSWPKVTIIDPAQRLADDVKRFLGQHLSLRETLKTGTTKFYFSALPYHLDEISQSFLGEKIKANIISLDD